MGAEYLLYKNISLQSRISFLRVVNIINFFDINTLLSKYANWGFKTFVVPESGKKQIKYKTTSINVIGVKTISEALRVCGF